LKKKIATLLLSSFLLATSVSAAASSPAPGFPVADGVDLLASVPAKVYEISSNESRGISLQSVKSYKSTSFFTGLYIGGSSNPTVFALNAKGYAVYSSIYQANVNPGESVQVTYQTVSQATGSTLAGKNLSGIQSSGKVDISTKVQAQTAVHGYMHNFTGNETAVEGKFNY